MLLPNAPILAPTTADGSSPHSASMTATIDAVVLLPWVPVTAMAALDRVSPASITPRGMTGSPRRNASLTSALSSATAAETTSASAAPTQRASCPVFTSSPCRRSRAVASDAIRSEPLTSYPSALNIAAIPLIPMPPIPTKCTRLAPGGKPYPPAARCRGPSSCPDEVRSPITIPPAPRPGLQ